MKYVCLGYHDYGDLDQMSPFERDEFVRDCLEYDDALRGSGNLLGAQALQGPEAAATLRRRNGQVLITDGPFAETKEQLGGFMLIEATDLNHAIHLLSKHPCMARGGSLEIRPINERLSEEIDRRHRMITGQSTRYTDTHNIDNKEKT